MLKQAALALLAATTILGHGAAARADADIPGDKSTKAVLKTGPAGVRGTFERKGDFDWYKVQLKGDQNYALAPGLTADDNCVTLNLRNAKGKVVGSATSSGASDAGFEFQPARTGAYFVEFLDKTGRGCAAPVPYPLTYGGAVTADARGDVMTAATIKVGQTIDGIANYGADSDFFRAQLQKGKSYTLTATGKAEIFLALVDAKGSVIERTFTPPYRIEGVQVPKTGAYYVVVGGSDDSGTTYTVTLDTP